LFNYLKQKPFEEVAQGIQALQQLEEYKEPEKEVTSDEA
jgi:hypothetical protein